MFKTIALVTAAAIMLPGCAAYNARVAGDLETRTEIELCQVYTMPGGVVHAKAIRAEFDKRKTFTPEEMEAINERSVFIGMRELAVRCSWGSPNRINRTTTAYGRSEQWVYYRSYVYLKNGKVDAIQSSSGY